MLFTFFYWSAGAQRDSLDLNREKKFSYSDFPLQLDSSLVYPPSVKLYLGEKPMASENYQFSAGQLSLNPSQDFVLNPSDSITVKYQIFSVNLSRPIQRINPVLLQKGDEEKFIAFDFDPGNSQSGLIDMKGLNYEGSFSRGISFGNAQNLVLNSDFNLRFGGIVGEDLEITAAISDQNIPLQPEGNTQQLQDFDKVFMEIKKGDWKLIAGDYELNRPQGYFQNYYKKLQGAQIGQSSEFVKDGKLETNASIALARGQFARNVIVPLEGNQGPYRLSGNQGEQFLIVLSGTEKVYIDGILLTRGLENDYTIDYNRAEVTFSQKRLITKDIRIIVEFEYSDQSFLRSVVASQNRFSKKKYDVYLNIYSEQDSRTSGSGQDLDLADSIALRNNQLVVSGIDTVEAFNEFAISYKLVEQLDCNGELIEYLEYSINPDSAIYTSTFRNVGFGNGDYELDLTTAANGRVYRYVAPDSDCESQGSFSAEKTLTAPNMRQMISAGGNIQLSKNLKLFSEFSLSNNDDNRFSTVGQSENIGLANKTGLSFSKNIGKKEKDWKINSEVSLESVQKQFQSLNPYRSAEFNRDWNLSSDNTGDLADTSFNQQSAELIPTLLFGISNGNKFDFKYQSDALVRGDFYQGFRQSLSSRIKQNGFDLDAQLSLLSSDGVKEKTRYEKPSIRISQRIEKLKNLEIGAHGFREWNERTLSETEVLAINSFGFNEYKFFIQSEEKENLSFKLSYGQRQDFSPLEKELTIATHANNLELSGKWRAGKISTLNWTGHIRQLEIRNESLTDLDPKNTFLGRIEHRINLFKGALTNSMNYELGSGQEPLIEYTYLEVQPGEGIFFWDPETSDDNGDNIPQINEILEAALPGQGNIQRISLFTNQFIQTNNNLYNQSLQFDPRRLWNKKKGILKTLSKFSMLSNLQINRKVQDDPGVQSWNPFQLSLADSSLVTLNLSTQHTLFFRPLGTKLDWRIGQRDRIARALLTTGFDARRTNAWFTRLRWNITKKWSTGFEGSLDNEFRDLEFFDLQDYEIKGFQIEPSFTFRPNNDLRMQLSYLYKESNNAPIKGGENAFQQDFEFELTFNQSSKTSIRAKLTAAIIAFDGTQNSPIELAMLDGLKNGENFLWEFNITRNLTENILLTLNYNGRKTGTSNIVHIGTVQVGARF